MAISNKLRKLIKNPGIFLRDALINYHPIELSDRVNTYVPSRGFRDSKTQAGQASVNWDDLSRRPVIADSLDVRFPIDLIFTWVDGADPEFIKSLARFRPTSTNKAETTDAARFKSCDELRYALRSINQYAPWVRNIYIVTNGQLPQWLDTEHPAINIVPHRAILEERYLPTFNSHVIESALHRIPGLAEHYLYLNDDMMLTRPVSPEYFFSAGGLAYMFTSHVTLDERNCNVAADTPSEWAAKNAHKLIQSVFNRSVPTMFAHTFYPQLRSVAEDNERRWPQDFHVCRGNRFRSPTDLLCTGFLHPHVAHLTGKAVLTRTRHYYFNVRKKAALKYYARLLQEKGTESVPYSVCPNDRFSEDSNEFLQYDHHLLKFLNSYYPERSPFERI
jgi:hypothetical protein